MKCKESTRGKVNYMSPDSGFLKLIKKNSEPMKVANLEEEDGTKGQTINYSSNASNDGNFKTLVSQNSNDDTTEMD